MTRPCLDLIVRHLSCPQSKHRVYPLLSRYLQVVFGFDVFEHDAEFNIVILKWMFLLDRLASESQPISFPVANHLLYGDDQWLPGREQRKCLLPPWELLPRDFLFDHEIPLGSLDVEFRVKDIESFLESFVKDEIEDERFDFLPLLLGWILCPNTRGWHDYEWGAPHPDSGEARTARLWQVLVHLQKIVHRNRVPSSGCAADDSLEIIKVITEHLSQKPTNCLRSRSIHFQLFVYNEDILKNASTQNFFWNFWQFPVYILEIISGLFGIFKCEKIE